MSVIFRTFSVLAVLVLSQLCVHAQNGTAVQTGDTLESVMRKSEPSYGLPEDEFHLRQLILPSALITFGVAGVKSSGNAGLKRDWQLAMAGLRGENYCYIDNYMQYVPIVMELGCGIFDKRAKHGFIDRALLSATATVVFLYMDVPLKNFLEEKRPDSGTEDSFPSGHTATAFMGAELVRSEYPLGYGIAAYTFAVGVAFLRTYNDRHWINDVIAGAGIGILSARIAHWLLPIEKKLLSYDERQKKQQVFVAPAYDTRTKAFGLTCNITF